MKKEKSDVRKKERKKKHEERKIRHSKDKSAKFQMRSVSFPTPAFFFIKSPSCVRYSKDIDRQMSMNEDASFREKLFFLVRKNTTELRISHLYGKNAFHGLLDFPGFKAR